MKDEFSIKFPNYVSKEQKEITKALKKASTEQERCFLMSMRKLSYLCSFAFSKWTEGGT